MAVGTASVVLIVLNGPSTGRVLVLVAMLLVTPAQLLAARRYSRSPPRR